MSLLELSVLGIAVLVLVVYIVHRTKHRDEAVWVDLVPEEAPAAPHSDSTVAHASEENHYAETADDHHKTTGGELNASTPVDNVRIFSGIDARRSTRIDQTVPLVILGTNKLGQSFLEETSAVSLNLHGCRYPSRYEYPVESWVILQMTGTEGRANSPVVRAKVQSIHSPQTPRELCQVGVEFETPGNVWGIDTPPEDWQRLSLGISSSIESASAREPATIPAPPIPAESLQREGMAEVMMFLSPASAPALMERAKELGAGKPERLVFTSDQLLSALQGELQQVTDKAVQTALAAHLDEAVRTARARFDEAWKDNVRQMEELSAERLGEVQARSDEQWGLYRNRAEEIARRLEQVVTSTRNNLAKIEKFAERVTHELEPQMHARLNESFSNATRELENAAAQASQRQFASFMQDTRVVVQSTIAQLRQQTEVQIDLAVSEAMQGIRSSLASLDAENRAACDARRQTLESDVALAAEQSTQEFRKAIKAFLYSCLVAAVSAVDEHAQATPDGFSRNQGQLPHEIAAPSDAAEKREQTDSNGGNS